MGLISKEYPDCLLNDYETQIRDLFFQTLETTLLNQQEVCIPLTHNQVIVSSTNSSRFSIRFCRCAGR